MPIFRRDQEHHARPRRLVRSGGTATAEEIDRDEVELEAVDPAPEPPEDEEAEPWARLEEVAGDALARLRGYREAFQHGDE